MQSRGGSALTFPRSLSLQGSQLKCWSGPGCLLPSVTSLNNFRVIIQGKPPLHSYNTTVTEANIVSGQE